MKCKKCEELKFEKSFVYYLKLNIVMRYHEILSEFYQEEATSTFGEDGVLYRLNDIFKSTEKALVFDVAISKLKWQMEKENDEDRINRADCSVPILVWKKGNQKPGYMPGLNVTYTI